MGDDEDEDVIVTKMKMKKMCREKPFQGAGGPR